MARSETLRSLLSSAPQRGRRYLAPYVRRGAAPVIDKLNLVQRSELDALAERLSVLEKEVPADPVALGVSSELHAVVDFRNSNYDEQTVAIMERLLRPNDDCIDVGAHVGDVLKHMIRLAPGGNHVAFEPLPELAEGLRVNFPDVEVHQAALATEAGEATFQRVSTNPSYSGLLLRRLDREGELVEQITVPVERLDRVVREGHKIRFIKIDVEGAEEGVFRGGQALIERDRPVMVFEHGLGAADIYNTRPETIFDLLSGWGYELWLMATWLQHGQPLSRADFVQQFESNENYYFMATPRD